MLVVVAPYPIPYITHTRNNIQLLFVAVVFNRYGAEVYFSSIFLSFVVVSTQLLACSLGCSDIEPPFFFILEPIESRNLQKSKPSAFFVRFIRVKNRWTCNRISSFLSHTFGLFYLEMNKEIVVATP